MSHLEKTLERKSQDEAVAREKATELGDALRDVLAAELLQRGLTEGAAKEIADQYKMGSKQTEINLFTKSPADAPLTRFTREPLTHRLRFDRFSSAFEHEWEKDDHAVIADFARELGMEHNTESVGLVSGCHYYSREFKGADHLLREVGKHLSPENRAALPAPEGRKR